MGIDQPRPPDVPPPPAQKPPDAARQAEWHSRNEATMTQRPERAPGTPRDRSDADRPDHKADPRQPTLPDAHQPRVARPESGGVQENRGVLSTDFRRWAADTRVVHEVKDVNQFRERSGHHRVDLNRVRADFTADIKRLAAERKPADRHHGLLVEVRLKHVAVGEKSEARAIENTLRQVGRAEGIHVRVRVEGADGRLWTAGGRLIGPPTPRPDPVTPFPPPPVPGPRTPEKAPSPSGGDRPRTPQPTPQPPRPAGPPPRAPTPVPPHTPHPPPDIHRR
ncbi:hypothetical protein [Plantactinospora sp. KBS50]|uniref:hypothetical protein n=1 Tax=Plantactinospora sp. KBS50 TaxID=2024580 RepID=UPI0012FDF1B8|nr:hypothetical protein [Plantactinospora sp. KBS50]